MKKIGLIATVLALVAVLAGCETEAQRVSYNLSQQADKLNDIRQVTVINSLQGEDVTSGDVNLYKYMLNFNPKMWLPEISKIE